MESLNEKKCEACEGIGQALNKNQIETLMPQLQKDWQLKTNPDALHKRFEFKNFYHTMGFVNAIAYLANRENHHPDLCVGYNYCEVTWTTHALKGLSMNDFICASKVDGL
jgi:4a-hydroxytetrahydrobiopterin dehydratase